MQTGLEQQGKRSQKCTRYPFKEECLLLRLNLPPFKGRRLLKMLLLYCVLAEADICAQCIYLLLRPVLMHPKSLPNVNSDGAHLCNCHRKSEIGLKVCPNALLQAATKKWWLLTDFYDYPMLLKGVLSCLLTPFLLIHYMMSSKLKERSTKTCYMKLSQRKPILCTDLRLPYWFFNPGMLITTVGMMISP